MGQKQKTEKKKERSKVGNNNGLGQLHIAMSPWVAHASRLGQLFVVGDPFPNTMLSCSSVKEWKAFYWGNSPKSDLQKDVSEIYLAWRKLSNWKVSTFEAKD